MDRTTLQRPMALLASAALLGSLAVVMTTAPAAAQVPSCDGQPATITDNDGTDADPTVGIIVGTSGPDVIVGTDGNDTIEGGGGSDIICGDLGDDIIYGFYNLVPPGETDGRDRIFGGSGDDTIAGGPGNDDLFGFRGNDFLVGEAGKDFLKGGAGRDQLFGGRGDDVLQGNGGADQLRGGARNDNLDGGAGVDDCRQGAGSGPIRNCERADLVVRVNCPAEGTAGTVTCRVKVTNRGPAGTGYVLDLDEGQSSGSGNLCINGSGWDEDEPIAYPLLKAGRSRTREFPLACEGGSGVQTFEAKAIADARDPRPGNNVDDAEIDF